MKNTKAHETAEKLRVWVAEHMDVMGQVLDEESVRAINEIGDEGWSQVHEQLSAVSTSDLGMWLWGNHLADVVDAAVDAKAQADSEAFIMGTADMTFAGLQRAIADTIAACQALPGADKMEQRRQVVSIFLIVLRSFSLDPFIKKQTRIQSVKRLLCNIAACRSRCWWLGGASLWRPSIGLV